MLGNKWECSGAQALKNYATANKSLNITLRKAIEGNHPVNGKSRERVEAFISTRRYTLERNSEGKIFCYKNYEGRNLLLGKISRPVTHGVSETGINLSLPKGFVRKFTHSVCNKFASNHQPRRAKCPPSTLRRMNTEFIEKFHQKNSHIKDNIKKERASTYNTCRQQLRQEHLQNSKSSVHKNKTSSYNERTSLKSILAERRYHLLEGRVNEIETKLREREHFLEQLDRAANLKGLPLNIMRDRHQSSQQLLLHNPKLAAKYSQHLDSEVQLHRSYRENLNMVNHSLLNVHSRVPIFLNIDEPSQSAEKINDNFEEQYRLKLDNMLHIARLNLKEIEQKNKIITQKFSQAQPKYVSDFFSKIINGDLVTIKKMLKEHPELVKERDNIGLTPLHSAAKNGNVELVRMLVDNGADTTSVDIFKRTPSKIAKKYKQKKVIRFFKELEINQGLQMGFRLKLFSHKSEGQIYSKQSETKKAQCQM